ncbi:hypothetical protein KR044_001723 [Drosophila immigrans]|nr:hypothetical protein KR044_001723 [Drosophila immigrans]
MNRQRRNANKNKTNIYDSMKHREVCFDSGYNKNNEWKSPHTSPDQMKQMTREQLTKYLRAYKTNYALLNFDLHPKFRPPRHMLPFIDTKPKKLRPNSCFYRPITDQLSRPNSLSSTSRKSPQSSFPV